MKKLLLKVSEYKLVFISVVFLVIFSVGCVKKDEKEIKIGTILPLTGSYAQYGRYMQQGIELALDDAIVEGVIKPNEIRLIVEDGQADPTKSVNAFQKLVSVDHVSVVIPATSGVTLAIKPIANRKNVVIVNASAISTEIEDSDDYCFSVIPDASIEGGWIAEYAYTKLGKKKAGILYRDDASGKSFKDIFKNIFSQMGGSILYEERHPPNEVDFRPYATKIASIKGLEIIFVASFGPEVARYVQCAREFGLRHEIITYATFFSPEVLKIAGDSANGVYFSAPNFNPFSSEPVVEEFKRKLQRKFSLSEVNYYTASHYDAMMLIIKAISSGNNNGLSIRNFIADLQSYTGKSGNIKFTPTGSAEMPLVMYTVNNLKFIKATNQ